MERDWLISYICQSVLSFQFKAKFFSCLTLKLSLRLAEMRGVCLTFFISLRLCICLSFFFVLFLFVCLPQSKTLWIFNYFMSSSIFRWDLKTDLLIVHKSEKHTIIIFKECIIQILKILSLMQPNNLQDIRHGLFYNNEWWVVDVWYSGGKVLEVWMGSLGLILHSLIQFTEDFV